MFLEPWVGEVDIGDLSTTEHLWAFILDPLTSLYMNLLFTGKGDISDQSWGWHTSYTYKQKQSEGRLTAQLRTTVGSPHSVRHQTLPVKENSDALTRGCYPQSWYSSTVHQGVHRLTYRYWSTQAPASGKTIGVWHCVSQPAGRWFSDHPSWFLSVLHPWE